MEGSSADAAVSSGAWHNTLRSWLFDEPDKKGPLPPFRFEAAAAAEMRRTTLRAWLFDDDDDDPAEIKPAATSTVCAALSVDGAHARLTLSVGASSAVPLASFSGHLPGATATLDGSVTAIDVAAATIIEGDTEVEVEPGQRSESQDSDEPSEPAGHSQVAAPPPNPPSPAPTQKMLTEYDEVLTEDEVLAEADIDGMELARDEDFLDASTLADNSAAEADNDGMELARDDMMTHASSIGPASDVGAPDFDELSASEAASEYDDAYDDELEVHLAQDELHFVRTPPMTPPRRTISARPYRLADVPPSPALVAAPRIFGKAADVYRRRWTRMHAAPASLADVPEELYGQILLHVPFKAAARLSLCSRAWSRALATAVTTTEWWVSASGRMKEEEARIESMPGSVEQRPLAYRELSKEYEQLLDALVSRCAGPAAMMALLTIMRDVSKQTPEDTWFKFTTPAHSYIQDPFVRMYEDWPNSYLDSFVKAPNAHEWTAEMLIDLTVFLRGFEQFDDDDTAYEDSAFVAMDLSEVHGTFRSSKAENGFAVEYNEVLTHALSRFQRRSVRTATMIESFGCACAAFRDFHYPPENAARLGSFAAACPCIGLEDVAVTVETMRHEMEQFPVDEDGQQEVLLTVLRTWATDARFPSAFSFADTHRFLRRVKQWDEPLRGALTPLIKGWLLEALAPLQLLLGSDGDSSPSLALAAELVDALRGE